VHVGQKVAFAHENLHPRDSQPGVCWTVFSLFTRLKVFWAKVFVRESRLSTDVVQHL